MNITLAFTLGVLSVFFVACVIILAWGIVRVLQLSKKITQIETRFENSIEQLWSQSTKINDYCDRSIADAHLHVDRRLEYLERDTTERFKDVHNAINDMTKHCISYTDSRVDKMTSRGKTLLKDDIN